MLEWLLKGLRRLKAFARRRAAQRKRRETMDASHHLVLERARERSNARKARLGRPLLAEEPPPEKVLPTGPSDVGTVHIAPPPEVVQPEDPPERAVEPQQPAPAEDPPAPPQPAVVEDPAERPEVDPFADRSHLEPPAVPQRPAIAGEPPPSPPARDPARQDAQDPVEPVVAAVADESLPDGPVVPPQAAPVGQEPPVQPGPEALGRPPAVPDRPDTPLLDELPRTSFVGALGRFFGVTPQGGRQADRGVPRPIAGRPTGLADEPPPDRPDTTIRGGRDDGDGGEDSLAGQLEQIKEKQEEMKTQLDEIQQAIEDLPDKIKIGFR